MTDALDEWRKRHNARFGIGTGRLVPIEEPTDDPHDGMLPTAAQEARAEAAAKARQAVAHDPESALSDPESRDWRGWLVLGAMALLALAFMAVGAFAQQDNCGPRADIAKRLTEKWGEAPVWMGLQGPEMVLEIWSAPASGTWTALYAYPDGRACIVAAGRGWEGYPLPVAGEPA